MGTFGKSRISDMRGGIREEWGGIALTQVYGF